MKNLFKLNAHAMARTASVDPLQKFNFRLTIPGLPSGIGFMKVSGLNQEVGVTEYVEGGYQHIHKMPGRAKVGDVTAEKGVFADSSLQELLKNALTKKDFRNTVIIEELNRHGEAINTRKLAEAWVSKWEGSDLDASSEDVAVEKITIQFEYFLD